MKSELKLVLNARDHRIPETFYFHSWAWWARWAHSERTVSKRWAQTERNLVCAYERWTVNEHRALTERKRERKVYIVRLTHFEWCVKAIWTSDEQFIRSAPGVILKLYPGGNQDKKKIANKLHVYIWLIIILPLLYSVICFQWLWTCPNDIR